MSEDSLPLKPALNRFNSTITLVVLGAAWVSGFGTYSRANEEPGQSVEEAQALPIKVMARTSGTPLRIGEKITATLNAGSVFRVERREGEWLWIDSGGIQGWVKSAGVVGIDAAVAVFNKAIEQNPEAVEGYLGRGLAREAHGEHDAALADFSKTIELDPKNHWAYHDRAAVYHAKQDYAHALSDSDEAIRLDAAEAAHWANRASVQFALKEYDKAIADYNEAVARLKGDEATFDAEGTPGRTQGRRLAVKWTCGRAECRVAKNAAEKAAGDYAEALRIDPGDPITMNSFAWLLATTENSHVRDGMKAFELAAQACDLTGFKNHLCLDTLAASYACAGDFAAAVKWQVAAIALVGSDERLAAGYRQRLALFMKNKPFLDVAGP